MKKILALMLVGAMALSTVACSKGPDGVGAPYLSGFKPEQYVKLPEYKGMTVTVPAVKVSEEEVESYLEYLPQQYPTTVEITDRAAKDGDTVNIDYVGKIDDEAFEGGSAEGSLLTLGSGQFIEGFEAGVVGMMPGEVKDLELKFPDEYHAEELAGKDVVFTVTLNNITEYEVPELTDDFVKTLGMGANTVDELREMIRSELLEEAQAEYDNNLENAIEEQIEALCTFETMPSAYVDRMVKILLEGIQQSADSYGVDAQTIAQYYYGIDPNNYADGVREYCADIAKMYIMLGAIAAENNIVISDEDVDIELQKELDSYGNPYSLEEYKAMLGDLDSYKEFILVTKVMEFLKENVVVNEVDEEVQ